MKKLLIAGASLIAMGSVAMAADMPVQQADSAVVAAGGDWSGYFAGLQAGYSWSDVDFETLENGGFDGDGSFDSDGALGGIYYGRNWQSGNFVYGLEGSLSFSDGIDFSWDEAGGLPGDNDLLDVEQKFLGTSRVKIGYAFDNVLLYAAGGLATGYFKVTMDDNSVTGGPYDDDSFKIGWTVGAGLETKFAENWSARIEYLYVNFDNDYEIDDGPINYETNLDIDQQVVRAGVAYHF